MQTRTELGRNRTGVQMSPIDTEAMTNPEGAPAIDPVAPRGDSQLRVTYAAEAEPLGTVPIPATMKGVAKSTADLLTGKRPQVLVDKLGERLAFERGGVRLYETLLLKCEADDAGLLDEAEVSLLAQYRDQEAEHFAIVAQALTDLGADPTAQTPCADLVGVESMGLVQAMNDPRTNLLQSLHVMLDAELIDNASWELLSQLASAAGHDTLAERFTVAIEQEAQHLQTLRELVGRLTLADAGRADAAS
jgi:rubrerythrin